MPAAKPLDGTVRGKTTPVERQRARVAAYVNERHGGSIRAAAAWLDENYEVLYYPLRRGGRPSLDLLRQLALDTKTSLDWWTR